MEIQFYKPKSTILQQYIEGYYFLSKSEKEDNVQYLTFPNNFSIISVFEKIEITFLDNKVILAENNKSPFRSDLICNYKKPIELNYFGALKEITFYFKPLGLNAFLKQSLSTFTNNFFSDFIPFEDYEMTMLSILREKDRKIQCENIEAYWISKCIGFEHPFLHQVIADLLDSKNDFSIATLAKNNHISRQNLGKHFENHLCKSPSDFKIIQRFREALKVQISNKSKENFTSLSCDLLFYDQSHLIKDFKSLTGLTPKKFFKNITSQENGEINWLFVQ